MLENNKKSHKFYYTYTIDTTNALPTCALTTKLRYLYVRYQPNALPNVRCQPNNLPIVRRQPNALPIFALTTKCFTYICVVNQMLYLHMRCRDTGWNWIYNHHSRTNSNPGQN